MNSKSCNRGHAEVRLLESTPRYRCYKHEHLQMMVCMLHATHDCIKEWSRLIALCMQAVQRQHGCCSYRRSTMS